MPTNLQKIMIYIEPIKKCKLKIIAEEDGRSMSNYIVNLIDKAIREWENNNQDRKQ